MAELAAGRDDREREAWRLEQRLRTTIPSNTLRSLQRPRSSHEVTAARGEAFVALAGDPQKRERLAANARKTAPPTTAIGS